MIIDFFSDSLLRWCLSFTAKCFRRVLGLQARHLDRQKNFTQLQNVTSFVNVTVSQFHTRVTHVSHTVTAHKFKVIGKTFTTTSSSKDHNPSHHPGPSMLESALTSFGKSYKKQQRRIFIKKVTLHFCICKPFYINFRRCHFVVMYL